MAIRNKSFYTGLDPLLPFKLGLMNGREDRESGLSREAQLFSHVAGHEVAGAGRHRWIRYHVMDQSLVGGGRDLRRRVSEYASARAGQQSTAPSLA
jgi:hypothetical protein